MGGDKDLSIEDIVFQYAMKEKLSVIDASTFLYGLFAVIEIKYVN